MFRKALEEWFAIQNEQVQKAYGPLVVAQIHEALDLRGLNAESIDAELSDEMKRVLSMQYEEPIGSTRLGGHGWTVNHIKEHMKRALKTKFEDVSAVVHEVLVGQSVPEFAGSLDLLDVG